MKTSTMSGNNFKIDKRRPSFAIFVLACSTAAFVLSCVSVGGSHWIQARGFSASSEGLWSQCKPNACVPLDSVMVIEDWIQVTRSFCIMAICWNVFAIFLIFMTYWKESMKRKRLLPAFPLLLSGLFQLIGMAVYALGKHFDDVYITYGRSFELGWIPIPLSVVAAIILIISEPSLCYNKTYPDFERVEENGSDT